MPYTRTQLIAMRLQHASNWHYWKDHAYAYDVLAEVVWAVENPDKPLPWPTPRLKRKKGKVKR